MQKLVLVACHHPFKSNGVHGGYFTIKHIFSSYRYQESLYIPMPVIGSITRYQEAYSAARRISATRLYTDMINRITDVIRRSSPNVVFVSGHDHNLQLIEDEGYNYVISGGGCKQNRTSKNRNSRFNSTSEGFAVMDVYTNKNKTSPLYSGWYHPEKAKSFPCWIFPNCLPPLLTRR